MRTPDIAIREMVAFAVVIAIVSGVWFALRMLRAYIRDASDYDEDFCDRCEKCMTDLLRTAPSCPQCGLRNDRYFQRQKIQRLTSDWPDVPREPVEPSAKDLIVRVYETTYRDEIDLWMEQFTARGVWCDIQESEERGFGIGRIEDGAFYHLLVRDRDRKRAEQLVAYFRDGKPIAPGS